MHELPHVVDFDSFNLLLHALIFIGIIIYWQGLPLICMRCHKNSGRTIASTKGGLVQMHAKISLR